MGGWVVEVAVWGALRPPVLHSSGALKEKVRVELCAGPKHGEQVPPS